MALDVARSLTICDKVITESQSIQGKTGLTYTAERVYSFGYTDGELATLRVVARPYDMDRDAESKQTEEHDHEIQLAVIKRVTRKNVTEIDQYFNLLVELAALFTLERVIELSDGGKVQVVSNRFFPLYTRSSEIMDTATSAQTTFFGSALLTFKEWVDE